MKFRRRSFKMHINHFLRSSWAAWSRGSKPGWLHVCGLLLKNGPSYVLSCYQSKWKRPRESQARSRCPRTARHGGRPAADAGQGSAPNTAASADTFQGHVPFIPLVQNRFPTVLHIVVLYRLWVSPINQKTHFSQMWVLIAVNHSQ